MGFGRPRLRAREVALWEITLPAVARIAKMPLPLPTVLRQVR